MASIASFEGLVNGKSALQVSSLDNDAETLFVGAVTVGTGPTLIRAGNANRVSLMIHNNGSNNIFIGNSDVTTAMGFVIPAGGAIAGIIVRTAIYGVAVAGTSDVRYLEEAL